MRIEATLGSSKTKPFRQLFAYENAVTARSENENPSKGRESLAEFKAIDDLTLMHPSMLFKMSHDPSIAVFKEMHTSAGSRRSSSTMEMVLLNRLSTRTSYSSIIPFYVA